jgi:hypothetical protein
MVAAPYGWWWARASLEGATGLIRRTGEEVAHQGARLRRPVLAGEDQAGRALQARPRPPPTRDMVAAPYGWWWARASLEGATGLIFASQDGAPEA